jgi:hypothetical protein
MTALGRLLLMASGVLFASAMDARAEWSAAAFVGASHTAATSLTLDQPSSGTHMSWPDVGFDSHSFEGPLYYGYRVGWFPTTGRLGVEGEWIHMKVFAKPGALEPVIHRFSISHGLNLMLGSLIWRQPVATSRVHLAVKAGLGFTVPHGESEVFGVVQEHYEVSSVVVQGAVGPRVRLADHLGAFAEYKLTTTRPSVSVAGGTIEGRYTSQHLAMGLEVRW